MLRYLSLILILFTQVTWAQTELGLYKLVCKEMKRNSALTRKVMHSKEGHYNRVMEEKIFRAPGGGQRVERLTIDRYITGDKQIIFSDKGLTYFEDNTQAFMVSPKLNKIFWVQSPMGKQGDGLMNLRDSVSFTYFKYSFPLSSKKVKKEGKVFYELLVGVQNEFREQSGIKNVKYLIDYEEEKVTMVEIRFDGDQDLIAQRKTIIMEVSGKEYLIKGGIKNQLLNAAGKPKGKFKGMDLEVLNKGK